MKWSQIDQGALTERSSGRTGSLIETEAIADGWSGLMEWSDGRSGGEWRPGRLSQAVEAEPLPVGASPSFPAGVSDSGGNERLPEPLMGGGEALLWCSSRTLVELISALAFVWGIS